MSSLPPRDADEKVRGVIGQLVEGITEAQRLAGSLPDVEAASKFATQTVERLVKERDEQRSQGASEATPRTEVKAEHAEGVEDPESARLIARPVGAFNWQARQFQASPGAALRQPTKSLEQHLTEERLRLLARFPDWKKRVLDAWLSPGTLVEREAKVMKVVEDSDRVFGSRKPRSAPPRIIIAGR